MATVNTNPIVNGLSGMLGKSLVFKNLRGKTIVASCPSPPQKQSEQQRSNRSKFRDAAFWAQNILLDPLKKEYYQKKARQMKLPNAYTAAITDYMRTPRVKEFEKKAGVTTYRVNKKDFDVKKVEVKLTDATGAQTETRTIVKDRINKWTIRLADADLHVDIYINITDEAGRLTSVKIPHCF